MRSDLPSVPGRASGSASSRAVWALGLLTAASAASALQVVETRDGVAAEALLSIQEPTRIRIEGAAITDVFGNLHSSRCDSGGRGGGGGGAVPGLGHLGTPPGGVSPVGPALGSAAVNPQGELVLECDRDKGEIYVRPVHTTATKPINLFISSAQATYTLLLRPADLPADTILIRDRSLRPPTIQGRGGPEGPAPSHLRSMKALLVAMAGERVPQDIRVEEIHRPVQLWAEARMLLLRRFEGRDLIGEHYLLHNISAQPMVLAEQEFDRPDDPLGPARRSDRGGPGSARGRVVAVSIEQHNLLPGASTAVYVIRRSLP